MGSKGSGQGKGSDTQNMKDMGHCEKTGTHVPVVTRPGQFPLLCGSISCQSMEIEVRTGETVYVCARGCARARVQGS